MPVFYRYLAGTNPVLYQYFADICLVLCQYLSGTLPIFIRYFADICPVLCQYLSCTLPIFVRYFADIYSVLCPFFSWTMCRAFTGKIPACLTKPKTVFTKLGYCFHSMLHRD